MRALSSLCDTGGTVMAGGDGSKLAQFTAGRLGRKKKDGVQKHQAENINAARWLYQPRQECLYSGPAYK